MLFSALDCVVFRLESLMQMYIFASAVSNSPLLNAAADQGGDMSG
jgi:hypothetical protein